MPIEIVCPCGKEYSLANSLAGKQMTCHECLLEFDVPEEIAQEKVRKRKRSKSKRSESDEVYDEDREYRKKQQQHMNVTKILGIYVSIAGVLLLGFWILFMERFTLVPISITITGLGMMIRGYTNSDS